MTKIKTVVVVFICLGGWYNFFYFVVFLIYEDCRSFLFLKKNCIDELKLSMLANNAL